MYYQIKNEYIFTLFFASAKINRNSKLSLKKAHITQKVVIVELSNNLSYTASTHSFAYMYVNVTQNPLIY